MDNSDLYKIWFIIMKALEYGPLKNDVMHLDQVIEAKVAHHHMVRRLVRPVEDNITRCCVIFFL